MDAPLISVVTPSFNARHFLPDAAKSILNQEWPNWEWLVVDNGSNDGTQEYLRALADKDSRIKPMMETRRGAGFARQTGVAAAQGEFFCFLDADDLLTPRSLSSRASRFLRDPDIAFVDGWVEYYNQDFSERQRVARPAYRGYPFAKLVRLSGEVLPANSWMIRRSAGREYQFQGDWTHSEDIAFYLSISDQGKYDYVEEPIYQVRRGHQSAMSNLRGLEDCYYKLYRYALCFPISRSEADYLKRRIRRIMFRTYLSKFRIYQAARAYLRFSLLKLPPSRTVHEHP